MNVIELTPIPTMPYSVLKPMEATDVKEKSGEEQEAERKVKERQAAVASMEEQKKARRAWEEYNKRRREVDRAEATQEEIAAQEALIKQGKSPGEIREIMASAQIAKGPQRADKEAVNAVGEEIKKFIDAGSLNVKNIKAGEEMIKLWEASGFIAPEQSAFLIDEINHYAKEVARKNEAKRELPQEVIDLGKKALEKKKRGEKLSSEEKEALEISVLRGYLSIGVETFTQGGVKENESERDREKESVAEEEAPVSEVIANARLSDEERIVKAGEILDRDISEEDKATILKAHNVGLDEEGKREGEKAGVYNYTRKQIAQKARVLKDGGFTREERRALLGTGIAGLPPEQFDSLDPASFSDETVRQIAESVKSEGVAGTGDSDGLRYQLSRIEARINAGTGDIDEARNLRNQIDSLMRSARQQESSEGSASANPRQEEGEDEISSEISDRGRERGRRESKPAVPARTTFEEGQGYEEEIDRIANLWKKNNPEMSDDDAKKNARDIGVPREYIASVNPVDLTRQSMESIKTLDDLKSSLGDGGFLNERIRELVRATFRSGRDSDAEEKANFYLQSLKAASEMSSGMEGIKSFVNTEILNPLFKDRDKKMREERGFSPYESMNQILNDVMMQSKAEYSRTGEYALVTIGPDGREKIEEANVLKWFRDKMYEYHDSDVDNPVDMFKMIQVLGSGRSTTATDWLFTPAMFTDSDGRYLSGLRDQVYMELWLFNTSRDVDAIYRRVMGDDEELPKKLVEIYYRNTFTKEGTMDRILTLPDVSAGSINDFTDTETIRGNQGTGRALRRALLAYYHVRDRVMLEKIEGDKKGETPLMNNKAFLEQWAKMKMGDFLKSFKDANGREPTEQERQDALADFYVDALWKVRHTERYLTGNKRGMSLEGVISNASFMTATDEELMERQDDDDATKKRKALQRGRKKKAKKTFKEINESVQKYEGGLDGRAKKEGKTSEEFRFSEFMSSLNPFASGTKDFDLINESKERVKLMIMQATEITYEEARYAETFAFSMARWTGLAARHDETASAYDSWSKVIQTEQYRKRQSDPNGGGIHGNPYSLAGFKRLGIDFLAGAKDLNGKSILELIQGGQGESVYLSDLDEIKFGNLTMEKFGTDHINRVFGLFHDIIEHHEFNFDKIVTVDQFGRVVFDPKGANEFIDSILKRFRYGYRTWGGTDYSKLIRVVQPDGSIKTMSIAESLWGREVYRDFVEGKDRDGKARRKNEEETVGEVIQNYRNEFWKQPMMYAIAAEIYAHRKFDSGYSQYKMAQVEKIYEWLQSFSGEVVGDEDDLQNTHRDKNKMFFTKADIDWIRKHSGTTFASMLVKEGLTEGSIGLLEGMGSAAKIFFTNVFK